MVGFSQKNIEYKNSVGSFLFEARTKMGFDLEQVADKINIGKSYLEALEKNKYKALPGKVYAINFLKKYAKFLGIEVASMLAKFEQDSRVFYNINISKKEKSCKHKIEITPRKIRITLVIVLILAVITYLAFLIYQTLSLPEVLITYPEEEMVLSEQNVVFTGSAELGAEVKINGNEVFVGDDGRFEHEIYLTEGLNEVAVVAQKKHSREHSITRKIMYLKN